MNVHLYGWHLYANYLNEKPTAVCAKQSHGVLKELERQGRSNRGKYWIVTRTLRKIGRGLNDRVGYTVWNEEKKKYSIHVSSAITMMLIVNWKRKMQLFKIT